MHIEEEEDEGGGEGGQASGSSHTPNFGRRKAPEPKTLDQLDEDESDLEEILPSDLLDIPDLDECDPAIELANGYWVGYLDGMYYLFNDDRKFIAAFRTLEGAVRLAYEIVGPPDEFSP